MALKAKKIAEILDISVHSFYNWARALEVQPSVNQEGEKLYPIDSVEFFKKIKDLRAEGKKLKEIKKILNKTEQDSTVLESESVLTQEQMDLANLDDKKMFSQKDLVPLTQLFITELKNYSSKAFEAEKRLCVLEENKGRLEQDCKKLDKELGQMKVKLNEKEEKLKEFESYKNKMNLLEVQLKLLKMEQKKKKFWQFWK